MELSDDPKGGRMTGAIVASWGSPVRGREAKGLESFGNALTYFEGLAKQGRIHGHKEYFSLTGNSSKWAGMMIIEGELDELLKLQTEDEYQRVTIEASAIVENFTTQLSAGGSDQAVQEQIGRYTQTLGELGYM
jgi:hypothetical protein